MVVPKLSDITLETTVRHTLNTPTERLSAFTHLPRDRPRVNEPNEKTAGISSTANRKNLESQDRRSLPRDSFIAISYTSPTRRSIYNLAPSTLRDTGSLICVSHFFTSCRKCAVTVENTPGRRSNLVKVLCIWDHPNHIRLSSSQTYTRISPFKQVDMDVASPARNAPVKRHS